jgi:hypothetical protein
VDDEKNPFTQQWGESPDVGKWQRIFIDLVLAPPPHLTIRVGDRGQNVPRAVVVNADLPDDWKPGPPGFNVGIGYTGSAGDAVYVDNVVFDLK